MEFDFEQLAADDRYKILTSTIVSRPIAWVTTLSKNGVRNAAPFSFFNAMSKTPPIVAIGIQANANGSMKDSACNILDTQEFVVNLVPRLAAEAMNLTSIDAPSHVDELSLAKLETMPSVKVKPERIAISPVAFECRLHTPIEVAPSQLIILGEIVQAHVSDEFVLDPEKHYIDTPALHLVGRMHGRGWYTTTDAVFQIQRPEPYAALSTGRTASTR
ncbi:flavin reductase [Hyphomicrobium denitrificans 1NES1]|uniref:Flavin reductase n=1 Tax=Hyphomicrobium denitrificans 1NES1 TaxID=670307 RepID=N0B6V6_9HYPH|nr:flavin reductase family protein [Hyphomicrobium denitrificans]AGK59349.1 flavin reductase [Hyphomicrobium denitrificans 1NES1]